MKIRHKILLTTLSTLILSGPVVLGLVSALVIKNPDTPTPPKPIAQEYKKIGNYEGAAVESDEFPAVYILKSKESTDENVLRFMEIKIGSALQNTYGCAGWTVFGAKIETGNTSDSAYNLAIDENTIPQTILVDNVEKSIVNICGFGGNTLSSIIVPNFIKTIGYETFKYCSALISLDLTNAINLTNIGESAFEGCTGLTGTLTIPASVTSIGSYAFYECVGLNALDLTNATNLTTIDSSAFSGCTGLKGDLTIPSSVTTIGDSAFEDCSGLTSLDLTKVANLTTIGGQAFYASKNLTGTLTIPASVTFIGDAAFGSGPHFTSISVDSANPKYALASSKSVGTANVVIDKTITTDLNYDYSYPPIGTLTCGDLTINNDPKITKLDTIFACDDGITSVIVQENITQIQNCFYRCGNLFKLDLSNANNLSKMTDIMTASFYNCPNLSGTLVIPENLSIIQIGNPMKTTFNESAFSSLIFKAATPSNDIDYGTIFQATIAQSLDKYTITVPFGSKTLYQAKFSSVPASNIIEE